jgi:ankyrin repeat protein
VKFCVHVFDIFMFVKINKELASVLPRIERTNLLLTKIISTQALVTGDTIDSWVSCFDLHSIHNALDKGMINDLDHLFRSLVPLTTLKDGIIGHRSLFPDTMELITRVVELMDTLDSYLYLQLAIHAGSNELVHFLSKNGADINDTPAGKDHLLFDVIASNSAPILHVFKHLGADFSMVDSDGNSLFDRVKKEHLTTPFYRDLLAVDASKAYRERIGRELLAHIKKGNYEIAEDLVNRKADLSQLSEDDGSNALELLDRQSQPELYGLLREQGLNDRRVSVPTTQSVLKLLESNGLVRVKESSDLDKNGRSALMLAFEHEYTPKESIENLVRQSDLTLLDSKGNSAYEYLLGLAPEPLEGLFSSPQSMQLSQVAGKVLLQKLLSGDESDLKILLKYWPDPNVIGSDGKTLLDVAGETNLSVRAILFHINDYNCSYEEYIAPNALEISFIIGDMIDDHDAIVEGIRLLD